MSEDVDSITPVTKEGGTYPTLPRGKKNYGNQFISIGVIDSLMKEINKNFKKEG